MKNIQVGFKGKKFNIKVRDLSLFEQARGLMFKTKNCDILLFNRKGRWSIHSFFVFFSFFAIWLDEKNNVLEYKLVKPFTFSVQPKNRFTKLIEIPLNKANQRLISSFPSIKRKV